MNTDTTSGKLDQVVGKVKQGVGEAVGDQELANSGAADQVKGNAKEAWGNVKDAASDTTAEAHRNASTRSAEEGDSLRDKIVHGATDAKNAVTQRVDEFRDRERS